MIVLVAATLGGDGGGGSSTSSSPSGTGHSGSGRSNARTPKVYVVESGDTLTSIARQTGVPVATIVKLNPGVDPQILIAGEELRLR